MAIPLIIGGGLLAAGGLGALQGYLYSDKKTRDEIGPIAAGWKDGLGADAASVYNAAKGPISGLGYLATGSSGSDDDENNVAPFARVPDFSTGRIAPFAKVPDRDLYVMANRRANKKSMAELRNTIADTPALTNELIAKKARRQVMPIFRPQIRQTKRTIRQTERQGRRAARQVQSYYRQAGQEVAGIAKGSRKATQKAVENSQSGGIQGSDAASREKAVGTQAVRKGSKAEAAFFRKMRGALAGEGAVAAADTRTNYKDLANQYRGDLADLRTERATALQLAKGQVRKRINSTASAIYEDAYLGAINQGMKPREAQKVALAMAETKGGVIEGRVARMIRNNKDNERVMASMQGKKGKSKEQWDRQQDNQSAAMKQVAAWQKEVDRAIKTGDKEKQAKYQAKIDAAFGVG